MCQVGLDDVGSLGSTRFDGIGIDGPLAQKVVLDLELSALVLEDLYEGVTNDAALRLGLDGSGKGGIQPQPVRAEAHSRVLDSSEQSGNCAADEQGQWFFQNGPQRVYLELEATPFIWRLQPDGRVHAHTGTDAGAVQRCLLDEQGRLYLVTALGLGLVHTSDMALAADAVERGDWAPQDVLSQQLPAEFGFVRSPQRLHAVRQLSPSAKPH